MILDTPLGPDVIATGALHRRDTLRTGVRTVWALDVPAPTYAFAFALAPFAYEEDTTATGLPVGSYSLPGGSPIDVSLPSVARAAEVLTALLGPYPYASYRAAQVPIAYAGMENASLAFIDPALTGDARTTVLVHELAHQWFGNHVALAGWEDLWLSEGMATYLATHVLEQHDPEAARARWIDVARLTPRRRRALVPLVRPPLGAPERHLTWVVYEKGASVLYLLRQTLGDAVFAQVLRETVRRYADQPLSTEAFQAVAEEASGHSLDDWFGVWVYGGEVPRLTARWNPKRRMLRWAVEGDGGTLAGVPVNLRIQQDGRGYDVPLPAQKTTLPRTTLPEIHPVGVMLDVKVLRDRTSDLPD
jgi:aminopeptidase N